MTSDEREAIDIEAEARYWREWNGETNCFGMVAKCVLLLLVVVQVVMA